MPPSNLDILSQELAGPQQGTNSIGWLPAFGRAFETSIYNAAPSSADWSANPADHGQWAVGAIPTDHEQWAVTTQASSNGQYTAAQLANDENQTPERKSGASLPPGLGPPQHGRQEMFDSLVAGVPARTSI